jgi:hypothetical protein
MTLNSVARQVNGRLVGYSTNRLLALMSIAKHVRARAEALAEARTGTLAGANQYSYLGVGEGGATGEGGQSGRKASLPPVRELQTLRPTRATADAPLRVARLRPTPASGEAGWEA